MTSRSHEHCLVLPHAIFEVALLSRPPAASRRPRRFDMPGTVRGDDSPKRRASTITRLLLRQAEDQQLAVRGCPAAARSGRRSSPTDKSASAGRVGPTPRAFPSWFHRQGRLLRELSPLRTRDTPSRPRVRAKARYNVYEGHPLDPPSSLCSRSTTLSATTALMEMQLPTWYLTYSHTCIVSERKALIKPISSLPLLSLNRAGMVQLGFPGHSGRAASALPTADDKIHHILPSLSQIHECPRSAVKIWQPCRH